MAIVRITDLVGKRSIEHACVEPKGRVLIDNILLSILLVTWLHHDLEELVFVEILVLIHTSSQLSQLLSLAQCLDLSMVSYCEILSDTSIGVYKLDLFVSTRSPVCAFGHLIERLT